MDEKIIELRKKIADRKGLPGFCAELLRGENEQEIKLDCEKLIKFIYPTPPGAMDQLKNIRATENIK